METPEETLKAIGELIKDGYTSGRLNGDDGTTTSWSINLKTWKD